jgi:GDP-L-fucose synthase
VRLHCAKPPWQAGLRFPRRSAVPHDRECPPQGLAQTPAVVVWGTGTARREFLYADDFADACVFVLKNYTSSEFINIGFGADLTIAEFARTVADVVGYPGKIVFHTSKPDGTPQKLLDVSRLSALRWKAKTSLREGLGKAYADFLTNAVRER